MSKKSESKIHEIICQELMDHGYKVISEYTLQNRRIDILAQKGNHLFAIEVKNRPIETFDIIGASTISVGLKKVPDFEKQEIMGVVTSGSTITEEAKHLGNKVGVIVTEPLKLKDSIEVVLRNSKGREKGRRKT